VLRQPDLTGAILVIRSAQEALKMADGTGWHLPDEELDAIEQGLQQSERSSG
jgi:hypothetical protein